MKPRDREAWRKRYDDRSVNGLLLPPLLLRLMESGRWKTPEDAVIRSLIPFLKDSVDFLASVECIAFESQGSLADDEGAATLFHVYRSSSGVEKTLPWRDVERSILIAVNREIGADVAIALDYRSGAAEPSVLASDWWTGDERCHWRQVCRTFTAFVELLNL